MTKTLQLTFLTEGDKQVTLTVDEPKDDLTEEEVISAMDDIIQSQIFEMDEYPLASAVSARVVERTVTNIFSS